MFKKLRNKLLIINTLIIAALVLSSFSVIYIMTAQNVNKSISQKLDRAIEFIRPDHNPRQKDNMQKPIDFFNIAVRIGCDSECKRKFLLLFVIFVYVVRIYGMSSRTRNA